jgi:hypothetical protein
MQDGTSTNEDTPPGAARQKKMLNVLSAASVVSELALATINASLSQANFRRPPKRRVLKRSY